MSTTVIYTLVAIMAVARSEEHTSELQSLAYLVCRLLLEKKNQSATSRQNTKDQVYAQNEMLAYQQKESTARVASIMENTNLSKQQQVSEIMRQMLTQAQTAGQYFTNDQIKEMTFFFNDAATTEIYTLSLHDALPI